MTADAASMPPTGRDRWFLPAGTSRSGDFCVQLSAADCGWSYASLRVLELPPAGVVSLHTGSDEMLVLPLSGSCVVTVDGQDLALDGRRDVFSGVTDFAYAPRDSQLTLR